MTRQEKTICVAWAAGMALLSYTLGDAILAYGGEGGVVLAAIAGMFLLFAMLGEEF